MVAVYSLPITVVPVNQAALGSCIAKPVLVRGRLVISKKSTSCRVEKEANPGPPATCNQYFAGLLLANNFCVNEHGPPRGFR
jgi:hypothetical protein